MQNLIKFKHDELNDILQNLDLPDDAAIDLFEQQSAQQVIATLNEQREFTAIIKLLAYGLPKREAIWWAYLCAKDYAQHEAQSPNETTLNNIEQWIRHSREDDYQQIKAYSDSQDHFDELGWAALAVVWSKDEITIPNQPSTKPFPGMYNEAVHNTIIVGCDKQDNPIEAQLHYIKKALHISMGGNGII